MIVATLFAPLSAPLVNFLFPILSSGGEWPYNQTDYLLVIIVSASCAYLALFVIGIPIYWILKRRRMLSLLTLSIAGAVSGALAFEFFLYLFAVMMKSTPGVFVSALAWGASLGFLVALTFGLIAGVSNVKDQQNAA